MLLAVVHYAIKIRRKEKTEQAIYLFKETFLFTNDGQKGPVPI